MASDSPGSIERNRDESEQDRHIAGGLLREPPVSVVTHRQIRAGAPKQNTVGVRPQEVRTPGLDERAWEARRNVKLCQLVAGWVDATCRCRFWQRQSRPNTIRGLQATMESQSMPITPQATGSPPSSARAVLSQLLDVAPSLEAPLAEVFTDWRKAVTDMDFPESVLSLVQLARAMKTLPAGLRLRAPRSGMQLIYHFGSDPRTNGRIELRLSVNLD